VFENEFDAVFSNAVLHWIKDDPDAGGRVGYHLVGRRRIHV
jgi:hypothetical protein